MVEFRLKFHLNLFLWFQLTSISLTWQALGWAPNRWQDIIWNHDGQFDRHLYVPHNLNRLQWHSQELPSPNADMGMFCRDAITQYHKLNGMALINILQDIFAAAQHRPYHVHINVLLSYTIDIWEWCLNDIHITVMRLNTLCRFLGSVFHQYIQCPGECVTCVKRIRYKTGLNWYLRSVI